MVVRRWAPGDVFAGRYVVEGVLGQGSMGTVYRAREQALGEARALKVMSGDLASAPDFAQRFVLEASIGELIASPHVVRVYESGIDEGTALPFYTMELLVGEDLARAFERGRVLDLAAKRALLTQLFEAIAAAHAAKVVHRDLKPENLFLVDRAEGTTLKVLDFGVAKVVRETTMGGTKPGLGTPLWTAPEQGREGQVIRPSADVWALGLLTYRVLSGKMYWRAATNEKASAFDLAVEMLKAPIEKASVRSREIGAIDLGPAFDAWFERCVDRDPSRRFASAADAFAGLAPLLERGAGAVASEGAAAFEPSKRPRFATFVVLGLVAIGLASAIAALALR